MIPQEAAVKTLLKAEELESTENYVREEVMKGVHPVEAYKNHGWF